MRREFLRASSFVDATVVYNGFCKINGVCRVADTATARRRHELFKKRDRRAFSKSGYGRCLRGAAIYFVGRVSEYRRQTFQSDVGIRCGGIGLSKISQGTPARPRTAEHFVLARAEKKCRNSARLQ